eukprot:1324906-Amorphochlora_amoeboformis.AAC.1
MDFDFSKIRPRGTPIKGFGGVASGSGVLEDLLNDVRNILQTVAKENSILSMTNIVDIMNMIGCCVIAGNVRRTAEIAFGPPTSSEYLNLKNYEENPEVSLGFRMGVRATRAAYGWASNNSVYAELGMDYKDICERIRDNGEPGFAWLDNMKKFSRMNGVEDNKDARALGGNPCLEQTLESYELCCLVETFPHNHESIEDFEKTLESVMYIPQTENDRILKYMTLHGTQAFLYAKTVTLGKTHWDTTNKVMTRNRRIGCSMTGIAQFITSRGVGGLKEWCNRGYDKIQKLDEKLSEDFGVP